MLAESAHTAPWLVAVIPRTRALLSVIYHVPSTSGAFLPVRSG